MKYTVEGEITVSCHCEVEADSEEEAVEIAMRLDVEEPNYQGCNTEDVWLVSGDGLPQNLEVTERGDVNA